MPPSVLPACLKHVVCRWFPWHWFQASPVTRSGLYILLSSFIHSSLMLTAHAHRMKTFSSRVGLDHRLLQFRLLRHNLRRFSGRSKNEVCWSVSIRTFSKDRWTGNHKVTRQLCAFCKHRVTFLLSIALLYNSSKTLSATGAVLTAPLQGHRLPNTSAGHRVSWGKECLIWADPGVSDLTDPKKYNSVQQWEEKSAGREARSFATGLPYRLHWNGFSSCAVVRNTCPWNLNTRMFNNIIFSAEGGQAVPFLFQVFLLDLDTCWKAAK